MTSPRFFFCLPFAICALFTAASMALADTAVSNLNNVTLGSGFSEDAEAVSFSNVYATGPVTGSYSVAGSFVAGSNPKFTGVSLSTRGGNNDYSHLQIALVSD